LEHFERNDSMNNVGYEGLRRSKTMWRPAGRKELESIAPAPGERLFRLDASRAGVRRK
jgi:hypothetical protein